ncbi:MAG: hypothetical protein II404_06305 [Prevotella sp.]|nr:hypothetical protein [Prevotella sp.]
MGIPSAESLEYVTDGQRYGMIVERIQGKESFGRIIADHPERLEELAGMTGRVGLQSRDRCNRQRQ